MVTRGNLAVMHKLELKVGDPEVDVTIYGKIWCSTAYGDVLSMRVTIYLEVYGYKYLVINGPSTHSSATTQRGSRGINISKVNNQNFVGIPHSRLIDLLVYKCEDVGIDCVVTEEAYTSKSSFLDGDELPIYRAGVHHTFSGKRTKRGVYTSGGGVRLNADVNGAYNIIRKAVSKAFKVDGIEGVGLHPLRVSTTSQTLFC